MKIDLTKILLVAAILYIGWSAFLRSNPEPVIEPVTVTVPKVEGTTGVVELEPKVVKEIVYIKGDEVEVDKGYKELYEKAKDSLEKQELYLQAIKINKSKVVIADNEDIKISGEFTTRGSLLDYNIDYTIKEKQISYTPEVVSKLPKLSLGFGVEAGVPTTPESNFVVKANVDLMNSKGNRVNFSYDTEQRVWFGFTKTLKIIK